MNDEEQCIGVERNGTRCIRIKRNGDYCWFHDPINPQICHRILQKGKRKGEICGDPLRYKENTNVTAKTKNHEGLFEKECSNHLSHPLTENPFPQFIKEHKGNNVTKLGDMYREEKPDACIYLIGVYYQFRFCRKNKHYEGALCGTKEEAHSQMLSLINKLKIEESNEVIIDEKRFFNS